eukprot:PITA_07412
MNKTLMGMERSMLSGAQLGHEFWEEVVETTCYLVNRSPSLALDDKTPQEVWTSKKPSLSHMRVFGCDAYVHVPKEKRTKLDSKSEKCIFIGEVKNVIKNEVPSKEPKKIEFELKEEESDSIEEEESEDEEPHNPVVRRSIRERRQPKRYSPSTFCSNFSLYITNDDPKTMKEAIDSEDGKLWKESMVEAWDLVEFLARRKPIGSKWVFKKKTNAEGKVKKYKDRLVENGYFEVPGIDFGDIFSPITTVASIRLFLSVFAAFDFEVEQMDVKTTFLHGGLEEEIYMKKP